MQAVLWIVAFAAIILVAGVLYQWIGGLRDRRRFTASGRWVTIGDGSKLYLFEMGAGEPTVLFEAGFGATHLNWRGHSGSDRSIRVHSCIRSLRPGLEQPQPHNPHSGQHSRWSCTKCCTALGSNHLLFWLDIRLVAS